MISIKVRIIGLEKVKQRIKTLGKVTPSQLALLGRALIADAQKAVIDGTTPEGKPWAKNIYGRIAFGASSKYRNSFKAVVLKDDTVRVGTNDVRAWFAHKSNDPAEPGQEFTLRRPAVVPLQQWVRDQWLKTRDYRTAFPDAFYIKSKRDGKVYLVQREEDSRDLVYLAVMKQKLRMPQRRALGIGSETQREAERIFAAVAAKANYE